MNMPAISVQRAAATENDPRWASVVNGRNGDERNSQDRIAHGAAQGIAERVSSIAWQQVSGELDAQGSAMIKRLLSPDECRAISSLYPNDDIFRSRVMMARYGFGSGEYKYFSYPL